MTAAEVTNRTRKRDALVLVLDFTLDVMGVNPLSPAALEFVMAMSAEAWEKTADFARVNEPSEKTKQEVRDLYIRRARASIGLGFCSAKES